MRTGTTWVLGALLVALAGCSETTQPKKAQGSGKPTVHVVNYPLQYFAERIGGDKVDVVFAAPADGDPAFWEPDEKAIEAVQKADLVLLNGATYAKWVPHVSLAPSKLVDTSAAFAKDYIKLEHAVIHAHGPEGKHEHGDLAFTTWIDFRQAAEQARAVKDALVRLMPDSKDALEKNFAALEADLKGLDAGMEEVAARIGDAPLVVSHPVYQYWARRYKLNVRSVHWEPDEAPEEKAWAALRKLLETHDAKWMVWEGEPMQETVGKLEAIGLGSVVFDPRGNVPDEGDFLSVMRQNLANIDAAFPAAKAGGSE